MKYLALGLLVSLSTLSAYATDLTSDMRYYTVEKMKVDLVKKDVLGIELREKIYQRSYTELPQMPYEDGKPSVTDEPVKLSERPVI